MTMTAEDDENKTQACDRLSDTSRPLCINVGGQVFTVHRNTLIFGSSYFQHLLANNGAFAPVDEYDIFVDRDADIFVNVLTFLRTGKCPIFYTITNGFDYSRYQLLKDEALFFGIDELVAYLERQDYHKAISLEHRTCLLREQSCELSSDFRITSVQTVVIIVCKKNVTLNTADPSGYLHHRQPVSSYTAGTWKTMPRPNPGFATTSLTLGYRDRVPPRKVPDLLAESTKVVHLD